MSESPWKDHVYNKDWKRKWENDHKNSLITYFENSREFKQVIMIEFAKDVGDIKINSVSIQKQKVKNAENNLSFFFFLIQ